MAEEVNEGVNPVAEAPVTPPVAEAPQAPTVSEDVKTEEKDYAALYENAKKALKETREKEKAERERAQQLERELQSQAQVQPEQDDEAVRRFYANEAKTNLLIMANTDPFVRDNIAELSQEIAKNPEQGAEVAIQRLKASYMDTIIKRSDIAKPKTAPQAANATATPEEQPGQKPLDPNLPELESRLQEMLGS